MHFSGFDWSGGNVEKCQMHGVSIAEIESLFSGALAILPTESGSDLAGRAVAIGWTSEGRAVFVVFTLRPGVNGVLIRPISARFMHKKELRRYEKENPDLWK
jgi:uncharacterized DUF497 family protein